MRPASSTGGGLIAGGGQSGLVLSPSSPMLGIGSEGGIPNGAPACLKDVLAKIAATEKKISDIAE